MNIYAHYFKAAQPYVVLSRTNRPVGPRVLVSGLREARKVAKEQNAKPWNF